jgi:hypothetical protein
MIPVISLAAQTYDLNGAIMLRNVRLDTSGLFNLSRRVNRSATLDGGAYIDDLGYSDGDRAVDVVLADPTEAQADTLEYLIRNYGILTVVLPDGAYEGAISAVAFSGGTLNFTVLLVGSV